MYDISKINIGSNLRKYRKINLLTLQEVAVSLNKTKATISKYEKNEITPDALTLLKLCNILNIGLSDLFPIDEHLNAFPFNTKLYVYYLNGKKLVSSIIDVSIDNYKYKAEFYNYSKTVTDKFEYYLNGTLEYYNPNIYVFLRNITSHMKPVQIIINSASLNFLNCFDCFIIDVNNNSLPTIRKGIVSETPITNIKKNLELLTISKDNSKQIFNNNKWIL